MPSTLVIVPCYNEDKRLDADQFVRFSDANPGIRFLMVNDGSTDGTAELLDDLHRRRPDSFGVYHLKRNRGKAEAVRRGLLRAFELGYDYTGYWDADLATPLEMIPDFCQVLDDRPQVEIVFGARVRLSGRAIRRTLLRHFLGRGFATLASLVFGIQVYDHICGAKMFRATDRMRSVFAKPFMGRWTFDSEIIARVIQERKGKDDPTAQDLIWEVPLSSWDEVAGSKVTYKYIVISALDLARMYVKYIR